MGIFPITPLVRKVQSLMLETFEVSDEVALDIAAEMVSLAEGWGGKELAGNLDWSYRIKKDLGETKRLKWRSEKQREEFETMERRKYEEWNVLIGRKSPQ